MGIQLNGTSGTDIISAVDGSLTVEGLTISGDFNIAHKIIHSGDTDTFIRFPAANTFTVETAGDERLRIDSTGKVGVGANPTAYPGKFVVSGDALICDRDIHSRVANSVANSDRGFKQDIDGVEKLHLYTDNSNNIILEGNGGAEKLRINNGGSVGIGTENPSVRLHVSNGSIRASNTAGTNFTELGSDGNIEIKRTGGSAYIDFADATGNDADCRIQHVSDGFEFSTGGQGSRTTKLVINSSGEVSIGAGAGSGKTLTLYGASSSSFRISKSGVLAYDHTFNGSSYTIANNNGSAGIPLIIGTKTGGGESLRIDANGRIQQGSDPSNLGQALVNIVTGGENGISLGKNQGGNVSSGDVLGTLAFQSGVGSQTTNSAEASIKAIAEENSTGTTAATGLYFYTKQSGTGPGSSPAEAFHINSQGMTCHTSTPSAKVYAFSYPLGTGGSTTTTTIATITNPQNNCLAVATINWSSSYGASGSTRSSGQFVCGVRRSQSGSAWSASTSELGPAGDGSYSIDCVWNGQTLQVTRGAWLNFLIDVRICVYNATITNNLI